MGCDVALGQQPKDNNDQDSAKASFVEFGEPCAAVSVGKDE